MARSAKWLRALPVSHLTRLPPEVPIPLFDRTFEKDSASGTVSQRSFPEDARWNAERQAVEFGVEIG
jgi:hypothetical protein